MDTVIPMAYGIPVSMRASTTPPSNVSSSGARNHGSSTTTLSTTALQFLREQGFTQGLAEALNKNKRSFALSIWVVDNSGSMATNDGHRIVEQRGSKDGVLKFVNCSRWTEMQQTVEYHTQMAALLQAPTTFYLLNDPGPVAGPQQFSIADKGDAARIDHDLAVAQQVMMHAQPMGCTPLVQCIQEIRDRIRTLAPQLQGQKVAVVLATDGLPANPNGKYTEFVKQQFIETLRELEELPVWVVVRLCTDEEDVVEFWNNLDSQLELSLEVLDDYAAEAKEVYKFNKWLTYGLPLHRMREMGFHHRIFDLMDERRLSKDELREFCRILFGRGMDEAPDPEADWKGFVQVIARMQTKVKKQYNPYTQCMEPWIDLKKLNKEFGHGGWFG